MQHVPGAVAYTNHGQALFTTCPQVSGELENPAVLSQSQMKTMYTLAALLPL